MDVRHLRRSSFRFAAKRQSEAHRFCASGGRFRQRGADRKNLHGTELVSALTWAGRRGGEKIPMTPRPTFSSRGRDLGPPLDPVLTKRDVSRISVAPRVDKLEHLLCAAGNREISE